MTDPKCPPRYVYEGHNWVLDPDGKRWRCTRCNATVGVMTPQ